MLGAIRNKSKGWLAYLIVGLITIPFALFGVNEYFTGASNVVVATVDDEDISKEAFLTQFNPQKRRLQQELGKQYDNNFDAVLKRSVLEKMINEALLNSLSDQLSHVTTDQELSQIIQANDLFHVDGKFSLERYEQILRLNGYSKFSYEASKASELTQTQLKYNLLDSAFITPSALARLEALNNQQRQLRFVTLKAADYLDQATVSQAQIQAYFNENQARFFDKAKVKIDYVELSAKAASKEIVVDEDALFNYYEDEQARFSTEEERQAQHILVADEQTANQIYDQLSKGGDFAQLAAKHSEDPGSKDSAGDLGFFTKGVMVEAFENTVFAMQVGETSTPVKSDFGYHIIRLNAVKGGETKSFESVRAEVEQLYRQQQVQQALYNLTEQLANLAYEGSLEEVAAQMGLNLASSDFFDEDTSNYDKKVIASAFSDAVLNKGENSEVLELAGEKYWVLRVSDKQAKRAKALNEVAAEIKAQLKLSAAKIWTDKLAQTLADSLQSGDQQQAEALMKTHQLNLSESKWVSREDKTLDTALLAQLFAMSKPSAGTPSYLGGSLDANRSALIELSAVKTEDKALGAALSNALLINQADELFAGTLRSLRDSADIQIFADRL